MIKQTLKTVGTFVSKNRRVISTIIIGASMAATVISAIKDAPKARLAIDDAVIDKGEDLTKGETVKVYAKAYWKTAALFIVTLALVAGNEYVESKNFTELATAYMISEKRLTEHKDAVLRVVGEKKAEEIEKDIIRTKMQQPVASNKTFINTGNGTTLFFDEWTGRYFYSDIEKVKRSINEVDRKLRYDDYVSADDFYWEIGLPPSGAGTNMGWSNTNTKEIDINLGSMLTEDDQPCITIKFREAPYYNFDT